MHLKDIQWVTKLKQLREKNPFNQLEASKSSIKDLFSDYLNATNSFKYQITLKFVLKKCKSTEIEFAPAYFNSKIKTMINQKLNLENSFQDILYRFDNWINKGSAGLLNQSSLNTLTF